MSDHSDHQEDPMNTTDERERAPEPAPVGTVDTLTRLFALMPPELRARARAHPRPLAERARERNQETPQEAAERAAERRERELAPLRERWAQYLPPKFAHATLAGLDAEDQHREQLTQWLDSGHPTLVVWSDVVGNGKTHALYAVCSAAVERGMSAMALTMAEFNRALRPGGDPDLFEQALTCDVFGIDDLGREAMSDWTLEQLQELIDTRMKMQRRLVVDTNLDGHKIARRYGNPIASRLIDDAVVVRFTGPPRRRAASW